MLEERIPGEDDARPEAVVLAMLYPENIATKADIAQPEQALFVKYGSPTLDDNSSAEFYRKISWCLGPDEHGYPCSMQYLKWSRVSDYFLDIAADYYRNKVEAAYNRILKAAKPQL